MTGWLRALFSFTPLYLQQMGFVHESRGIRSRYRHCRDFWREHLAHCHAEILAAARSSPRHRRCVVMGAGLLYDVPLAELSGLFEEVVLVDVVHPLGTRWALRRHPNVRAVRADVTESLERIYEAGATPREPLQAALPTRFVGDGRVDLVVSLNLLSQLPCMPMSYLRRAGGRTEAQLEAFARELIQAHLDYLARLPGEVLLITDIQRLTLNLMGHTVETRDLLYSLPVPEFHREWTWKLAPAPEVHPSLSYFRRVVARRVSPRPAPASTAGAAESRN